MTRRVGMALTAALAAGVAVPAAAQTVDGDVQLSYGLGYSDNPFLFGGDSTGTATVDGEVRPSVAISEEHGRARVEGFYRRQEYARRYSGQDSYGGSIAGNYRFSPTIILTEAISYQNSIVDLATLFQNGLLDESGSVSGLPVTGLPVGVDPVGGGTGTGVVTTPLPASGEFTGDASLIGLRQRRSQLNAALTLAMRPNQTDNWQFALSGRTSNYPNSTTAVSYRAIGFLAGYLRNLSPRSILGATVIAQTVTFSGSTQASHIYTPELVYSRRLPRGWTVELGGGISVVDGDSGLRGSKVSTSVQASACQETDRVYFCLLGTRTANPAGIGRVNVQTTARASYLYKLTDIDSIRGDASFSKGARATLLGLSGSQRFYSASLAYLRNIGRQLQATAQVGYQDRDATGLSVSPDLSARLGIIFRLDKNKLEQRR